MFRRRKSIGERLIGFLPVLVLVGLGSASVIFAMNVLVRVAPVAIGGSPSPSPTISGPSFAVIPSYAIDTDAPPTPASTMSIPATSPVVRSKQLVEHDPAGVWNVSIAYPVFQAGSTPWASQINDEIGIVERMQADKFEQGPAGDRQRAGKTNNLQGTFTTELLTPRIASFTLTWVDDTVPGHVAIILSTLNLDLATGQPIEFDNMFTDPDTALQILSSQASDILYYQLGAAWDQAAAQLGTAPTHANFENWAVTRAGLKVTFDQFQVLSGDQTPVVVVPWSALSPVLAGSGPVAELTGANLASPAPSAASPAPSPSPGPPAGSPAPSPQASASAGD